MKKFLSTVIFVFLCFSFYAQEDGGEEEMTLEDGVGFDFKETTSDKGDFSVNLGGFIYTGLSLFFNDFTRFQDVKPSSLVWGNLKLEAMAPLSSAFFSVNLNDQSLPFNLGQKVFLSKVATISQWINEAFLQINVGAFYFFGGLKKLNWGRSDLFSVLDVVNPQDETNNFDITENKKISVPMFQLAVYMPYDLKLEGVFLPIFVPSLFALDGRWKSYSIYEIENFTGINEAEKLQNILSKDTAKFFYSHGGLKLTTTIALTHDLGFQYFYGYSKKPIIEMISLEAYYPCVHNIGIDYGTVVGPFNLRTEFCANIVKTKHDGIRDSNIAWNAGFDFRLKYGITLNMLLKETIYFNQRKNTLFALFRNNNKTDTLFFLSVSQNILRGAMEWKFAFVAGFENVDFAIMPSIRCLFGTIILDTRVGIFLGKNAQGSYSQYKKNNFVKLSLGYEF